MLKKVAVPPMVVVSSTPFPGMSTATDREYARRRRVRPGCSDPMATDGANAPVHRTLRDGIRTIRASPRAPPSLFLAPKGFVPLQASVIDNLISDGPESRVVTLITTEVQSCDLISPYINLKMQLN